MESDEAWQDMERMVEQEDLWQPNVAREEVREALAKLYRSGDPSSLAPYLRDGGGAQQSELCVPDVPDITNVPIHEVAELLVSDKDCFKSSESNQSSILTLEIDREKELQGEPPRLFKNVEPSKPSFDDPSDKCNMCEYVPSKPSKKTIRIHKDSVHFGVKYPCVECKFVSTTKSNLLKHIDMRHSGKKYHCTECSFNNHSKDNLKRHIKSTHSKHEFKCTVNDCNFSNGLENIVLEHEMKEHHEKKFHCLVCFTKFSYIKFLRQHIKHRHSGLFCDLCLFQPWYQVDLETHNLKMHEGVIYPCKQCKTTCLSQLNLLWHMGTKHNKRAKRTQKVTSVQVPKFRVCDICGYKPAKKISSCGMRVHKESVHFGIKYKCLQCQHQCTTKSNLNKHIAEKHESKIFQCSSCSFTAKKVDVLRDHNSSVHLGIMLFCSTYPCSYSTDNRHALRKHNSSHHSASMGKVGSKVKHQTRAFNCSTIYSTNCATLCKTRVEIEDHYKMIHEGLSYDCLECDYSAINKELYDKHCNRNHTKYATVKDIESHIQEEDLDKAIHVDVNISEEGQLAIEEIQEEEINHAVNAISEKVKCLDCGKLFTKKAGLSLVEHFTQNCGCLWLK